MPTHFTCPHCGRLLSVARRKVGQVVQCVHCRGRVVVPPPLSTPAEPAPPPATDQQSRIHESPTQPDRGPLVAWDDTVPVSRGALYSVGGLIVGVAIVSFLLGWAMGRDLSLQQVASTAHTKQRIYGQISYVTGSGRLAGDSEAVALALPVAKSPDEKLTIEALRPDVAPPNAQDPTVQGIRSLGGDFARTGARGEYELEVPAGGQYFVLLISNHAPRPADRPPTTTQIVEMGKYFKQANDLLGEHDFLWLKQLVRNNKKLDHVFGDL